MLLRRWQDTTERYTNRYTAKSTEGRHPIITRGSSRNHEDKETPTTESLVSWYRQSSRRRCQEMPIVSDSHTRNLFRAIADDSTTRRPLAELISRFLWSYTEW